MLQASPGTVRGTIFSITSNTQLTLVANASASTNGAYGRQQVPSASDDVVIGNTNLTSPAVTVTLDVASATVNSLTFAVTGVANSLTHSGTNSLTVNNNVIVNQSTAAVTIGWNVNGGTASVGGTLTIGSANTTAGHVAQIAVTTGSLTLTGATSYAANSVAANEVISVSTGTIAFNSALTLGSGTLSITSTGTIDFKGNCTYGSASAPVFNTVAGSNIIFEANYTGTASLLLNGASNAIFAGNSTITPPSSPNYIGFGNVQLNSGSTVTLASGVGLIFYVGGNWTNNGGTLSAAAATAVQFFGSGKTIGGTSNTTFPIIEIYNQAATNSSYMMNNSNSATGLLFDGGTVATSLTLGAASVVLTINGTVTLNQPTASVTEAWNINAGTATVSGLITFAGTNTTTTLVSKTAITTGTLNANGGIIFAASAAATKVIDMSGGAGTLNLKGALTVPVASSTLTAGISGSIFNYADTAAQTVNFFSAGAYHNLHTNNTNVNGATLSAAVIASNVTGNLRVQTGTFSNGGFAIAGNAGKVFEVVNGATFKVAGTISAFPTAFGTVTLGATSTVDYSGTLAQIVAAQNYGHLTISASRAGNNVTLAGAGTIGLAGTLTETATFNSGNGFVTTGSTVAYNGTSSQTVTALSPLLSGSIMYNNLTINNSSGVLLSGNVTVGGTLTFTSGNITTSSNALYLNPTGTVSRTTGHVVGNFKKNILLGATSKTFEIGDASNYTPVSVSFASVTTAGDLTASTTTGDHPNIGSSIINSAKTANRYWTLTNGGIIFASYSATFNFVAGDLDAGANTNALIVGKFASGAWSYPAVGTRTGTSTQTTGVSSFSDFQLGEPITPNIDLQKSVSPSGPQAPDTDLVYTIIFTNSGSGTAQTLAISDPNPNNIDLAQRVFVDIDYKLGSASISSPWSATIEFSNDGGATWSYTPVSGGGGAPAGYDRTVTNIRWSVIGNVAVGATGTLSFTVRIR